MNYEEARHEIRSGDLLAWGHDAARTWHDWEIQLVRMATRSEYSHVGVAWVSGGRVWVIEAVVPEVRTKLLSKLLPCYWYSGEVRAEWTPNIEKSALDLVGEPYSKMEAIKSFFGKVRAGENKVWQCAETAYVIRDLLGVIAPMNLTPAGLVRAAKERGCSEKILRMEWGV